MFFILMALTFSALGVSAVYAEDLTLPETAIDSGPSDSSNAGVTFTFSSHDPAATFECQLDGGGWIDSSAGAYIPDPTLTGKATFDFVSMCSYCHIVTPLLRGSS